MTTRDQPGLRMRLAHEARRIARQHAVFEELRATTREALESGALGERRKALLAFTTSLEAHFALEETVQFPALHGLHPECGGALTDLVAEHHRFRGDLAALAAQDRSAAEDDRAGLLAAFEQIATALRSHEDREEALLDRTQVD